MGGSFASNVCPEHKTFGYQKTVYEARNPPIANMPLALDIIDLI
jgi:hypothetical protein